LNFFISFRALFVSASLALALGPLMSLLAVRAHLVDIPNSEAHKRHKNEIPYSGGAILLITVAVTSFLGRTFQSDTIRTVLLVSTLIFLFGLWDDAKNLRPAIKFGVQILATFLLINQGIHVKLFAQDWLNYLITIIWMVGLTNAFNFIDSMDGLAVGLAGVASAFFMLIAVDSRQYYLSIFSTILMGACFGVYYWNASPARLFLGDSGAQWLGFVLAGLGIAYNPLGFSRFAAWYVPILLLAVPIFDMTLVVVSRLRRKKPIYHASLDHTYHRLVQRGMSQNRAILSLHCVAALLGSLALIILPMNPWLANGVFGLILVFGLVTLILLDYHYDDRQAV
jgi:UDP-GlcNAc:undecaprenyl-phosphate/decaprenyl-phosphate GlcNAc-1-phosphate transferase